LTPFIYPFQANYIRHELNKLLRVVYFVGDYRVYQATKDELESTIHTIFGPLTKEQASLFAGITEIKGQRELNEFMDTLHPYVIPFSLDVDQVRRLFKKEKKLTIPDFSDLDLKTISYLGWRDVGKNHLYLVYPFMGELTGIQARYTAGSASNANVCFICNQSLTGSEIGLVVAKTKSSIYQSVGNYMCLDSVSCNRRMTSVNAIEEFFAKVMAK
jgi:FBP C-terminal treble-clef zinc-finger/Elongation factor G-binding protein, N-terminal